MLAGIASSFEKRVSLLRIPPGRAAAGSAVAVLAALLLALFAVIGYSGTSAEPAPVEDVGPAALDLSRAPEAAQALLSYAKAADYRRQWATLGPADGYRGHPVHAAHLTTYLNPTASNWLSDSALTGAAPGPPPDGALILQEGRDERGEPVSTWMALRRDGYASAEGSGGAGGDWFWARVTPEGDVAAAGAPEECVFCHVATYTNENLFSVAVLAGEAGPGAADSDAVPSDRDTSMAAELWRRIGPAPEGLETWTVGIKGERYESTGAHGEAVTLLLNETAAECLDDADADLDEGAVLVLRSYDGGNGGGRDGELMFLDVMWKVGGYAPDHGNWYWARFESDGTVVQAGREGMCLACHEGARSNDYVLRYPLRITHL